MNHRSEYRAYAAAKIAASLAGVRHPHGPHPLYTQDEIVKVSTDLATKLVDAIVKLEEQENPLQVAESPFAPSTLPQDAPTTNPQPSASDSGGDATKGDDAGKATVSTDPPASPAPKRAAR